MTSYMHLAMPLDDVMNILIIVFLTIIDDWSKTLAVCRRPMCKSRVLSFSTYSNMNFIRLLIFLSACYLPSSIFGSKKIKNAFKSIAKKFKSGNSADIGDDVLFTTADLLEEVSRRPLEDALEILICKVADVVECYTTFYGSPGEFSFVPILESLIETMDYSESDIDSGIKMLMQNLQVAPWSPEVINKYSRIKGDDLPLLEALVFLAPLTSDQITFSDFLSRPLKIIKAKGKNYSLAQIDDAINIRLQSELTMKPLEVDPILNALNALKYDLVQADEYGTLSKVSHESSKGSTNGNA